MAKPYREGAGWCMRKRHKGADIYVSGHPSKAAAEAEVRERMAHIDKVGKPLHLGPHRTTLAQALQQYGLEHLPRLKGGAQECRRINKYLAAAGVPLLEVSPVSDAQSGLYFEVRLSDETPRRIPRGLVAHRRAQMTKTAGSDKIRQVLAQGAAADIKRLDVQRLVDALREDGLSGATIALERALLRSFFNYARRAWHWDHSNENPANGLKMPKVDPGRERVLSMHEEQKLDEALESSGNRMLAPVIVLLRETAMRVSEPILHATWGDVDWTREVLHLSDGKDGARDVPLSPRALEALRQLGPGDAAQRIVGASYEALKAGFRRACERAGIEDIRIHDLRHTAATRMALATGNMAIVKALTGHKTDSMVGRYVNVKADDVVNVMRSEGAKRLAQLKAATTAALEHARSIAPPGLSEGALEEFVANAVAAALAAATGHTGFSGPPSTGPAQNDDDTRRAA
ncbi:MULTISPECIES: site-specific integrase [unclassified Hydrogenophaga]|uniref:tyrosine-type recombinase/integrase n=1 Tax=unclassified Hydrogenophaga TaxID=2610897 RepID=UPI000B143D4D|nr:MULTISPECIES: site-specific integrase [unclassified Hydrogenophaga]MBN9373055.1 site-specific integrase [Hydrogenophaga sp.]